VASIERTERSAVGDHFGWHPATGPDVDKRDGHVFVGNLLAADAPFPKALLRFDQTAVLQGKLTKPQVAQLDGNVYVREGESASRSLIAWSPAVGEANQIAFKTPAELHQQYSQFEGRSQFLAADWHSVFRSPELQNFDLIWNLPAVEPLPADVRQLLGWTEQEAATAGAYPRRR